MQQKILIGLILTLIIVIFIPLYWATEPGRQEAAQERQQAGAIERGAELYSSNCATCHGRQGEGSVGPALKGTQLDKDALTKTITRGIPGTVMPAWGVEDGGPLKTHQIEDLVTFIKNWEGAQPTVPAPAPQPSPSATDAGKQLYQANCMACHGADGAGGNQIGSATAADLRWSKLGPMYGSDLALIRRAILNGENEDNEPLDPVMPRWQGKLSVTQADTIIAYLQSLR